MYPVDKLLVLCTDVLGGGLQFVFCFYLGLGTFPWTIADQIVCTLCWGDGLQFASRTRAQKCEWQREIQLKIGTHLEQKMRKIVATPWSERFKIIFLVWSLLQDFSTSQLVLRRNSIPKLNEKWLNEIVRREKQFILRLQLAITRDDDDVVQFQCDQMLN